VVAIWFAIFALPMLLFTPDSERTGKSMGEAVREGLSQLAATFAKVRDYRDIAIFLAARVLYIDGLTTLFVVGAIFAGSAFGLSFEDIILFGIAINVFSGVGAALFGWIDDRVGPKPTILFSIACLSGLIIGLLFVESVTMFWALGLPLGIFVGPIQAASRSMMAHLAPPELRGEMFGLFAFAGKATAFVGPILLGAVTAATGSQRLGMLVIVAILLAAVRSEPVSRA
jgi:UMF1 family MFS transporter